MSCGMNAVCEYPLAATWYLDSTGYRYQSYLSSPIVRPHCIACASNHPSSQEKIRRIESSLHVLLVYVLHEAS